MKNHLALLRGVNVGGNKKVAMADLRACVAAIGFQEPRTLLQSGNLAFRSNGKSDDATLETLLEAEVFERLGLKTVFIVRTVEEWAKVIARNPFTDEAATTPSRLVVMFCRTAPTADAVQGLYPGIVGGERIHADGRHLYATFPDGISNSPMSNILMSARFSRHATGRNWNTVTKLGAMAGS